MLCICCFTVVRNILQELKLIVYFSPSDGRTVVQYNAFGNQDYDEVLK
jgi:hypothetical protein